MGVTGGRAHSPEQLAALAKEATDTAGPRLIHVVAPEHMDVPPPAPVWQAARAGESASRPIH